MKARHWKETFSMNEALKEQGAPSEIREEQQEQMRLKHGAELKAAWDEDVTEDGFAYDLIYSGAWFCLDLKDTVEADNLPLETEADWEKARRIYEKVQRDIEEDEGADRWITNRS